MDQAISFWRKLFHPLFNERGEFGEGDPGGDDPSEPNDEPKDPVEPDPEDDDEEPEAIVDGVDLGGGGEDDEEKDKGKKKEKKGEGDKKPEEDKGGDVEKRLAELEKNYAAASAHVKDLQVALHQTRQENKALKEGKGKEEGEVKFTDAQLQKILDDNQGDHGVLLRVVEQKQRQVANELNKKTLDEVDAKQNKEKFNAFFQKEWPEVLQEGSEIRGHIDKIKAELGVDSHPYGDAFAAGMFFMTNWKPALKKATDEAYERGKTEALGGKVKEQQKKLVKEAKLSPTGKGAGGTEKVGSTLSPRQLQAARQMGIKPGSRQEAIYKKLVSGKGIIATVEA